MNKNKSVILYINSSNSKKVVVEVSVDGKKNSRSSENNWTSQALLPLIDGILKENNLKFEDLTEIKLHEGPGSYTGLRIGAAVANTLSYILKIPINGKKDKIIIPHYS